MSAVSDDTPTTGSHECSIFEVSLEMKEDDGKVSKIKFSTIRAYFKICCSILFNVFSLLGKFPLGSSLLLFQVEEFCLKANCPNHSTDLPQFTRTGVNC